MEEVRARDFAYGKERRLFQWLFSPFLLFDQLELLENHGTKFCLILLTDPFKLPTIFSEFSNEIISCTYAYYENIRHEFLKI